MLKQINILGLRCRKLRTFPGKFLNFGKSAGVKDLTNIMSAQNLSCKQLNFISVHIIWIKQHEHDKSNID